MRSFVVFISLNFACITETVLGIAPGPAAMSLGCTGVVSDGLWSVNQNPACLLQPDGSEIAAKQLNRYRIGNWNDVSIGFSRDIKGKFSIGTTFSQEGFTGYKTSNISVGVGLPTARKWRSGITLGWESTRITATEIHKQHRLRTIIGSRLEFNGGHILAFAIDDLQSVFKRSMDPRHPVTLRTGFCVPVSETFSTTLEMTTDTWSISLNGGVCYVPKETVSIRIGYSTGIKSVCGGIGYQMKNWRIETAVRMHPFLGISTSIGITFRFSSNEK